jgi:hypothetical protein
MPPRQILFALARTTRQFRKNALIPGKKATRFTAAAATSAKTVVRDFVWRLHDSTLFQIIAPSTITNIPRKARSANTSRFFEETVSDHNAYGDPLEDFATVTVRLAKT